jgi:hypothetical protein
VSVPSPLGVNVAKSSPLLTYLLSISSPRRHRRCLQLALSLPPGELEVILTLFQYPEPFLSLFNMTEVDNPNMVDYASVAVFEVHNSTAGDLSVELHFRNGSATASDGSDIVQTQMWGQDAVALADFKSKLAPYAITELGEWCNKCGNTDVSFLFDRDASSSRRLQLVAPALTILAIKTDPSRCFSLCQTRGCNLIDIANASTRITSPTSTYGHQRTSPLVAGIIGAIIAFVLAALAFLLLELWRNKKNRHGGAVARGKKRGVVGEGESVSSTLSFRSIQ